MRDGEIDSLDAQRQISHAESQHTAGDGGAENLDHQRRVDRFEQEDGRIHAEPDKCAAAEIHIAGIAAQNVPSRGDDHILQGDEARIEHVGIGRPDAAASRRRRGRRPTDDETGICSSRDPENAAGPDRKRCEQRGEGDAGRPGRADEGDDQALQQADDECRDQRARHAAHAGQHDNREVRPIYSTAEKGSTGLTTISAAPASEAVIIAMPKACRLTSGRG